MVWWGERKELLAPFDGTFDGQSVLFLWRKYLLNFFQYFFLSFFFHFMKHETFKIIKKHVFFLFRVPPNLNNQKKWIFRLFSQVHPKESEASENHIAPWTPHPQSGRVVKFTAVSSWVNGARNRRNRFPVAINRLE